MILYGIDSKFICLLIRIVRTKTERIVCHGFELEIVQNGGCTQVSEDFHEKHD